MSAQSFTVTTDDGNSHYYKIASIEDQPNNAAIITIITGDLLDPGAYPATLVDGDNRVKGEYALFNVLSTTERVQYVGIFTPARQVQP